MQPGMMPPLNLNLTTASRSGDLSAPNTVNFGSFGAPTIGGGIGVMHIALAVAGLYVFLKFRR